MEQFLSSEEIKALRKKARSKTSAVRVAGEVPQVSRFDSQQSGQLSPTQTLGVEALHKACATQMGRALSTLLHVGCELNLASIEHVSFAAFVERLPDPTYLASFSSTLDARVLLQIDLPLVFPMLDLILGGSGKEVTESRDLTEIEQDVFEPVSRTVCRELRSVWEPILKIDFQLEQTQQRGQAAALISPTDKILLLSFEVRALEVQGKLHLAFPSIIAAALLRKFLPQEPAPKPPVQQNHGRLREHLMESFFEAEMVLPQSTVSIRELYELTPGDVLVLKVRSNEPVEVNVAGQNMFLAVPVRCGTKRGAQVQKVLSIVPKKEGE